MKREEEYTVKEDYQKQEFEVLGKTVRHPVKKLDVFPAPPNMVEVTLTSDEVTSLCPVTGQPDWETVTIKYIPDKLCIESKSLKLYLWSFREEGVFCESLASRIYTDVVNACKPRWCQVTVRQKPRGGVAIEAVAGGDSGV